MVLSLLMTQWGKNRSSNMLTSFKKAGAAMRRKTEVNVDIKAAFPSAFSQRVSSVYYKQSNERKSKPARWGATLSSKQGLEHAEKTEVILFIGLHAVQNHDKSIKSNILAPET